MPEPTSDGGWVSVHAFYQDNLDTLLTDVVEPLIRDLELAGIAEEFFFLRYWDGGPHLRLRVRPLGTADSATVAQIVSTRFEEYLRNNPSAQRMTADGYTRLAEVLARREGLSTYADRPYPNNTVVPIPYRREHDRYGHGAAMNAVEWHFVESSRLALRVVCMGASNERRLAAACALLLLTGFISGAELSPATEERDARAATVSGLARRMHGLAGGATASTATGALVEWARSVTALRNRIVGAAGDGPAPDVRAVLDGCTHLVCNRLGVSTNAEAALRRTVTRVVEVSHIARDAPGPRARQALPAPRLDSERD